MNLKIFYKKWCLEREVYLYLQMKVLQFNRNRFQSFKIPFKFTFHGFFPLHKIIFFEVGLFFIQWMLKINIPTSPLPLWEHVVRSKKDILFITLESFTNIILSKLRFSSLRKFKRCFSKKNYLFGAANVKSQKGMILAGELQFTNFRLESHFWHHVAKGETLRKQKWAPHLFNTPHAGAIYNKLKV